MVVTKSIWSDQNHFGPTKNCFGHIEGQGISKKTSLACESNWKILLGLELLQCNRPNFEIQGGLKSLNMSISKLGLSVMPLVGEQCGL